jgi:glycosyltransferase involved in cell wall biosynthesis
LKCRPVVISSIDPACDYLTHRENAFIAEPEVASFTKEIDFILDNPEKASKIAKKGQQAALKSFDYKIHVERIHQFLNQL